MFLSGLAIRESVPRPHTKRLRASTSRSLEKTKVAAWGPDGSRWVCTCRDRCDDGSSMRGVGQFGSVAQSDQNVHHHRLQDLTDGIWELGEKIAQFEHDESMDSAPE